MNPEHVNTWVQTNTHHWADLGKSNMIGLDSECQPMGQISCVMMRNLLSGEVCVWGGCVCVYVTLPHTRVIR